MKQIEIAENIKAILVDLACKGDLPLDLNELDPNLLLPAFSKDKHRYKNVETGRGIKVYDKKDKKYL